MISEEELFAEAAALPAPQRAAYLDEACAGEPEMRARLNALLQSHNATGFMEGPTPGPDRRESYAEQPANASAATG